MRADVGVLVRYQDHHAQLKTSERICDQPAVLGAVETPLNNLGERYDLVNLGRSYARAQISVCTSRMPIPQ